MNHIYLIIFLLFDIIKIVIQEINNTSSENEIEKYTNLLDKLNDEYLEHIDYLINSSGRLKSTP